ncbi:hypothetical protein MTO96_009959 [Rhipicephalus appendiculatus]
MLVGRTLVQPAAGGDKWTWFKQLLSQELPGRRVYGAIEALSRRAPQRPNLARARDLLAFGEDCLHCTHRARTGKATSRRETALSVPARMHGPNVTQVAVHLVVYDDTSRGY